MYNEIYLNIYIIFIFLRVKYHINHVNLKGKYIPSKLIIFIIIIRELWCIMIPYLYIARTRILNSLAYRFEVFVSLFANVIVMLAMIFLWKAAYVNIDNIAGVNEQNMITYTIVSILLSLVFTCDVDNSIYRQIREGEIAVDFYKPINLLGKYLAEDIGSAITSVATRFLSVLIAGSLIFSVPLPASPAAAIIFIPSCILSFGVFWLLSAIVGLIAFWTMELGNMGNVKNTFVRIFSGMLFPLWFFPEGVQKIFSFLPFQYIYQTPAGIYIGKYSSADAIMALSIQGIWIIILFLVLCRIWSVAKKRVQIQGG